MVRKIILLNSANFSKAVINLDAKAIQIIGRNNAGKTSLIGVLNFLYITNKNDWNFGKEIKETLHFYFPKLDKNYILFEIHKSYSFCILIRRDQNNQLIYYKIDRPYNELETFLFKEQNGIRYLLDFESIEKNLIGIISRYEAKDYSKILFGESKKDKSVLWLSRDIKQSTFTKIYKNLLNTKSLTNAIFKESLLVADGKEKKYVEFNDANNQNINKLKKILKEISMLKTAKTHYEDFKKLYDEYKARVGRLEELLGMFEWLYPLENRRNRAKQEELLQERNDCMNEQNRLQKNRDALIEQKGAIAAQMKTLNKSTESLNEELQKIKELEPLQNMKTMELQNVEIEIKKIEFSTTLIKTENYNAAKIAKLIASTSSECDSLQKQIAYFDRLLRHHISQDSQICRRLNAFLSEEILNLDSSAMLQKIQNADNDMLKIFDGVIDVSMVPTKDMVSVEELASQLQEKQAQLEKYKAIEQDIINKQELENRLLTLHTQKNLLESQLAFISSKTKIEENLQQALRALSQMQKEIDECVKMLEESSELIQNNNAKTALANESLAYAKKEAEKLENQNSALNSIRNKYDARKPLKEFSQNTDNVYLMIRDEESNVSAFSEKKNIGFSNIKNMLQKEHAQIEQFIEEIDEDMLSLEEKEHSTIALVESVTNETCKPTAMLIDELEHFKSYISSINAKLKKYKISNVESIEIKLLTNHKLLHELQKIAHIQKQDLFTSTDILNERLAVLSRYIESSKRVGISELFELTFVVDGKEKKLHEQVESNGTDIMIKMSLLMLIISNLIIQDEQNKLVLYLDELAAIDDVNVKGFIDRAYENGFVSVLAAPRKITHVDRYYELFRQGKEQISIDERSAIDVKDRF